MAELITREDTIKYLCKNMTWYDEDGNIADDNIKLDQITDLVYGIQGVEERKVGKWIRVSGGSYIDDFRCSCCNKQPLIKKVGYTWGWDFTDYCPKCGAEMRGVENE